MSEEKKFEEAMVAFLEATQKDINEYSAENFKYSKPNVLSLDPGGRKYIRVVTTADGGEGQRSVFCFVNLQNGDVMKAESWKSPAKTARGNIYTPENYGVSRYGARYL